MEKQKLKLLYSGRKGILLKSIPDSIDSLFRSIEKYLLLDSSKIQITFKDREKDECEVLDNETYLAACSEFSKKVIFTITAYNSVPISRIYPLKIPKNRVNLIYLKKNSRKMGIFDIDQSSLQWVTFQQGITFKEFSAWVKLPSGEIFCCGGGHPLSSSECFILNPYTQTYKKMPDMLTPRHSHGIVYENGFIYVFGGMSYMMFLGNFIKNCERFSLESGKWEDLGQLNVPVGDSAAVIWSGRIFVVGKGCNYIAEYGCERMLVDLKEDEGGCMIVEDGKLYVFRGSKVTVVQLCSAEILEEIKLPQVHSWWSHSPPVFVNGSIYFVWWEEPGWICKYDTIQKSLTKLQSLYT